MISHVRAAIFVTFSTYLVLWNVDYVTTEGNSTTVGPVLFQCYECNSGLNGNSNTFCPGHSDIVVKGTLVVTANCTSGQKCFTRENKQYGTAIFRGCSGIYTWGIPSPLPEDGCYDWKGDNICFCSTDRCNKQAIGDATGIDINAHLTTGGGGEVVIRPPVTNRGKKVNITCYICNSGEPGKKNPGCPKNGWVTPQSVYKDNCTGRCTTHNNVLDPDVEVYRGCTDTWYKFPKPFARDGCFKWYLDIVCICNHDYCNAAPLGSHKRVWLDAHLSKGPIGEGGGAWTPRATLALLMTSFNIVIFWCWTLAGAL